jgi:hypothetical protein
VVGELISGDNINIVSGANVQGIQVPETGSTLVLMGIGLGLLVVARKRLTSDLP